MTFLPSIEVEQVSKAFWIPHEQRARLKEYFAHPFKRVRYERNDALRHVTFSVQPGEFFGVIGANGSGKSTLLKLLAHIYRADGGTIRVRGRLSPFIELGVGFNPEFSARRNIEINGMLIGMTRAGGRRALRRGARVRRAGALRRPAAQELLVRDAAPSRVLGRDPGAYRHPPPRRGARRRRCRVPGEVLPHLRGHARRREDGRVRQPRPRCGRPMVRPAPSCSTEVVSQPSASPTR